jgi:23S rRNA (adenine2503-C2)-methyltransferase
MTLPLVFEAPRRGKPPRHLADLDPQQRRAALSELGLPAYRADQLSRHYFTRLIDQPEAMTDLPAADRDKVMAALLPTLLTPIRTQECDAGTTRKTLWRLFDGALVESVLMGLRGPRDDVCLVAGRLRHGLSVLRNRAGRAYAQPLHR